MTGYKEFQQVKLRAPLSAQAAFGGGVCNLAAGQRGTILDRLADGRAFHVEFSLREPSFGPQEEVLDYGQNFICTLTSDQIEPVR